MRISDQVVMKLQALIEERHMKKVTACLPSASLQLA